MHASILLLSKTDPTPLASSAQHHELYEKEATHLADWAVGLQEVWLEVGIEKATSDAFNGVIDGQYMHPLSVLDISTLQGKYTVSCQPSAVPLKSSTCTVETAGTSAARTFSSRT